MAIDTAALGAPGAPPGWDLVASVFTTVLTRTIDFLTPLARPDAALVDVRLAVVTAGPAGATRLEFRDDDTVIFDGLRRVAANVLTRAAITARGLRFVIELNRNANNDRGTAIETLCHEYGGTPAPGVITWDP